MLSLQNNDVCIQLEKVKQTSLLHQRRVVSCGLSNLTVFFAQLKREVVQSVGESRDNTREVTEAIARLHRDHKGLADRLDSETAASRLSQETVLSKLAQSSKKIEQTAKETKTILELFHLAGVGVGTADDGQAEGRSSPPSVRRRLRARSHSAERTLRSHCSHYRSYNKPRASTSSSPPCSSRLMRRSGSSPNLSDFSSRLGESIEKYFSKTKREPVEMRNVERYSLKNMKI